MVRTAVLALVLLLGGPALLAAPIDGRSAGRWVAQPGWSPGRAADVYGLRGQGEWLEFWAEGKGRLMTWTLRPTTEELAHEPRYLLFTYRGFNLDNTVENYVLSVRDGSPSWRQYVSATDLVTDGQAHTVAIDLFSYRPPEPINWFAVRIGPASDARGRLLARITFADTLPPGVTARTAPPIEPRTQRIEVEKVSWNPSPHFTPRPPTQHEMTPTPAGIRFRMSGYNRSMRWSASAPEGLDLGAMPYVSIRYRARGRFGPFGYALHISAAGTQGEKLGESVMEPGDVEDEGAWHVFRRQLPFAGTAQSLIIGIDSLSPDAEIEMDYIEFSSVPPADPISQVVEYERRPGPWPRGKDGLTTVALPRAAVPPNIYMIPRMGIGAWFDTTHITVDGIPFEVPDKVSAMPATGTAAEDSVTVDLPRGTTEALILLAAAFPRGEMFGTNWSRPTPLRLLSEPGRVVLEFIYADGTSDQMLPVHAAKKTYGIGRGIAVYAARPSPGKTPVRLALHDRMRNACFGILGVTANTGKPRVPEPARAQVWYPPVKKPPLSDATFSFRTEGGLTWRAIESPMLGGSVSLAESPVFLMKLGEKEIPSSRWRVQSVQENAGETRITSTYEEAGVALRAVLVARREERNSVRLSLELVNEGTNPVTGTLFFPYVSGLKIGSVDETWYFVARRGGVIHHVPCAWRDEIGEKHPLQVDGFFNPRIGAGICFLPRDTEERFRWYRVEKDESGGTYALEFLPETVQPKRGWSSVPVVVAIIPGDWKDQFNTYLKWVKTWHKPTVPRKQWFREVFAFAPGDPTSNMSLPVEQRIDFVSKARRFKDVIGVCDYVHLFGWAKTEEYGHWGDYDHYDAIGGRERFVQEVRRIQETGTPLGLYLDGYLVSTRSLKPTQEEREKWAVRQADGKMLYHTSYVAHSMCPYVPEWRDYLTKVYQRVAAEVKPDGMYLDEFGKSMVSRICYSAEHGHPVPMGMAPGEGILSRQVREAIPPEIATYCEFVPSDVMTQYLDGGFGHVALDGHRDAGDPVAPHYVNLHRFAFPDFKTFELIYYVPQTNGNWYLLKYPFFNGDGYYLTSVLFSSDEHAQGFYRSVFRVQHEHKDAFTADDVEPLVTTRQPGLFANRFSTPKKTVWTLLNTNHRTLRGHLMTVPHRPGARYYDAWNQRPITANVRGDVAELVFDIGPREVGCIVQQ